MKVELAVPPNEKLAERTTAFFPIEFENYLGVVGNLGHMFSGDGSVRVVGQDGQLIYSLPVGTTHAFYATRSNHAILQDFDKKAAVLISPAGETLLTFPTTGLLIGGDYDIAHGRLGLLVMWTPEEEEDDAVRTDAIIIDVATGEIVEQLDLDAEISIGYGNVWTLFVRENDFVAHTERWFIPFLDGEPQEPIKRYKTQRDEADPGCWFATETGVLVTIDAYGSGAVAYDLETLEVISDNPTVLGTNISPLSNDEIAVLSASVGFIWNVRTNEFSEVKTELQGHSGFMLADDRKTLLSISSTKNLCVWDFNGFVESKPLPIIATAVWSPNGSAIALGGTSSDDKKWLGVYEFSTSEVSWFANDSDSNPLNIRWRSDTEFVVFEGSWTPDAVSVWNTAGERVGKFEKPEDDEFGFVGPDKFVSYSEDTSLRVYDLAFKQLHEFKFPPEHSFSESECINYVSLYDDDYDTHVWSIERSAKVPIADEGFSAIKGDIGIVWNYEKEKNRWFDLADGKIVSEIGDESDEPIILSSLNKVFFIDDEYDLHEWTKSGVTKRGKTLEHAYSLEAAPDESFFVVRDYDEAFVVFDPNGTELARGKHPVHPTDTTLSRHGIVGYDPNGLFWALKFNAI